MLFPTRGFGAKRRFSGFGVHLLVIEFARPLLASHLFVIGWKRRVCATSIAFGVVDDAQETGSQVAQRRRRKRRQQLGSHAEKDL